MSLWARAQQLPPEHLQKVRAIYYVGSFSLEVRHWLASWLEARIWANESEDQQRMFLDDLCREITVTADMMTTQDTFVTKMKLFDAAKQLQLQYGHSPHELYAHVKSCFHAEMEIIESCLQGYGQSMQTEMKYSELINGLKTISQEVALVSEQLRVTQAKIESFSIHYHECGKHKVHLNFMQSQTPTMQPNHEMVARLRQTIENLEVNLNDLMMQIKQSMMMLVDRLKANIDTLRKLQSEVLDRELIRWKREQQLNGNGVRMSCNLDAVQEWCEKLAELIWVTRTQVNNALAVNAACMPELASQHLNPVLKDAAQQITCLLTTLVTSTFVIEKQPPQVMKTNTRFTATVRLLVGGQLNVHMTPPRVSVTIISEQQAQLLLNREQCSGSPVKEPEPCGDILNNTGTMEFPQPTKHLSVTFRNMQLRKIKRAEKKGTESVMDEKLTLFFSSTFKVGGGELDFQVWTLSLPVVVIVHGNQEPHGWATVTWDNAFSQLDRVPFHVPEKVSWGQLAETLCVKFKHQTGGDLTQDNLRFLAEKIFRASVPANVNELNQMLVSWTQFCKDALPERNFTFWEWFYMVMKVTRDHLKQLWSERLIIGFIQKKQAEEMLSECPSGTFLLRFSDSELGGVTIAWVAPGADGDNEVYSLQPFITRDLLLRSVADRVMDLPQLQYLYPNIPKDAVFSKYYTKPDEPQKNGYVKTGLVLAIPGFIPHAQSPDSHRNTPSVNSSHSRLMLVHTPPSDYLMDDSDLLESFINQEDYFTSTSSNM